MHSDYFEEQENELITIVLHIWQVAIMTVLPA